MSYPLCCSFNESCALRSRSLILTVEGFWIYTEHWFNFNVDLFLQKTWSDDSVLQTSLDFQHKHEFKQQDLAPSQMWIQLIFFLTWNLTFFKNPFHVASRNKKLSYFVESNWMALLHAIKACNNRLFRDNNWLFLWLS